MCDIRTLTTHKTKTVYKVVFKKEGKYITPLTYMVITIGKVAKMKFIKRFMPFSDYFYVKLVPVSYSAITLPSSPYYNFHMTGKTSGFSSLKIARIYKNTFYERDLMVILKIKLGGSIYSGTGRNTMDSKLADSAIVYAGSEILSIEEVK